MISALLLSGGMDSIALAWWKRPKFAFTLDYGQLAAPAEIESSRAVSAVLGIQHHILTVNARPFGSGDMAGLGPNPLAPATDWWPYRNQLLVTVASMRAVSLGVDELMIGTVASDCSHLDGTLEFVNRMDALLSCQEGGLRLRAPAIEWTTAQLVRTAGVPMSTLAWAHSCHKANVACGSCRGCNKYFEVLAELADEPIASN